MKTTQAAMDAKQVNARVRLSESLGLCLLFYLSTVAALGDGSATQTSGQSSYSTSGNDIVIQCQITYTGTPSTLGWSATIPDGWTYVSSTATAEVKPNPGETGTLGWAWFTVPASPVQFSYTLSVPAGQSGAKVVSGSASYRLSGQSYQLSVNALAFSTAPDNKVTLTLNLHDGSPNGPLLAGVNVAYTDGSGIASYGLSTGTSGSVTITGVPGTWQLTASKTGYGAKSWSSIITSSVQQDVFLTSSEPKLAVSPSDGLAASGFQGGPFSPASKTYTVSNAGSGTLSWVANQDKTWVTLSKSTENDITFLINENANSLTGSPAGTGYTCTVTFEGNGGTMTRSIQLTVYAGQPPVLAVSPPDGLSASGMQGGPFTPASKTYTVSNTGGGTLSWVAIQDKTWVTLSKQTENDITVLINDNAKNLIGSAAGTTYTCTVTFEGNGGTTNIPVNLTVAAPPPSFQSVDIGTDISWNNNGQIIPWMIPDISSTTPVGPNDYDVVAGGLDIWSNADGFRLVYTNLSGDFDMKVRVASLTMADNWSKAGLIAREGTNWSAAYFYVLTTPTSGVNLCDVQLRSAIYSNAVSLGNSGSPYAGTSYPNMWLRLQRTGDAFQGYRSADGLIWTSLGTTNISMAGSLYVGLATTAHDYAGAGLTTTAQYRELTIVGGTPPSKTIALSGNLAFGNVTVGTTAQRTLTIANNGNTTLTVSAISYPNGFSGAWSGTIPPNSSHNITMTFAPTTATSYTGNLTVASDKTDGNNVLPVSGIGTQAAAIVALAPGSLSQIYDGSPKAVTASTTPGGLPLTITYSGNPAPPTKAGTYTVAATVNDPNYAGSTTGTLTILKATATVILNPTGLNQVYDGSAKVVTAAPTPSGLNVAMTYNGSATPPRAAGSYALIATVNDPNYSGSASGTLVVGKASLAVSGLSATSKVYDATISATIVGTSAPIGVIPGDAVTLTGTAIGSFTDKSAGNNKLVTVAGLSLAGADAGNYAVSLPVLSANITPAPLAVSGLTASNKTYDGTTTATITGAPVLAGTMGIDAVSLSVTVTGTFGSKAAGNSRPVSLSGLILSGVDAGNYTLALPSLSANITPATLTVSGLTASNKVYDGTTAATVTGTPVLAGDISGDTVSITGAAMGTFADKTVGNKKPVTLSGLTLGGPDAGNYTFSLQTLSANITPATLMVTASDASRAYGAPNPEFLGTIAGLQIGDGISATYTCEATTNSPAGNYPITPHLVDANGEASNYAVALNNGTLTVTALPQPTLSNPALAGNNFSMTVVTTVAGVNYILEYTDSLNPPQWKAAQTFTGDGNARMLSDTLVGANPRFYRLRTGSGP
jgi:hypothetical protein